MHVFKIAYEGDFRYFCTVTFWQKVEFLIFLTFMITNCLVQILLRISICFFHENMKALHTIKSSKIQENDSLLPKIPKRPKPANPFWKFNYLSSFSISDYISADRVCSKRNNIKQLAYSLHKSTSFCSHCSG